MTYAFAAVTGLALSVIALLAVKLVGAVEFARTCAESLLLQGKAQVATDRQLQLAEVARDDALRHAREAEVALTTALARLASNQAILDVLQAQGDHDAVEKVRTAPDDAAALAALRELLAPLPGVSAAGDPGRPAAGSDHAAADPLHPAAGTLAALG